MIRADWDNWVRLDSLDGVVSRCQVDTEVWVRVAYEDKSYPTALWHIEKFWNRVYLMRELYQVRTAVAAHACRSLSLLR